MLILQRKKGESLIIGDNIKISVLDSGNDGVKLAIEAPKEVKVLREELLQAMKANEEAAASSSQIDMLKQLIPKQQKD